jgi:glycosyltransferase involved in cell wall biosynthesis
MVISMAQQAQQQQIVQLHGQNDDKIRLLTLSDHPLSPSGIGIQAHQLITGLLSTGRYRVYSIGAAMKHHIKQPMLVDADKYGEDWIVFPVEGFGDPMMARQWMAQFNPHAVFMFTDPRFFTHMFSVEDEIRDRAPILFWTVWDNEPTPRFNKQFYDCCDDIAFFSNFSYNFHKPMEEDSEAVFHSIPLARNKEEFFILPEDARRQSRIQLLGWDKRDVFTALFVSRNARRKRPADIIKGWVDFINGLPDEVKNDPTKCPVLLMHCDPSDHEGPNLQHVMEFLGTGNSVVLSPGKASTEDMTRLYNVADVTINFSMNEGFGMSAHESLLCGTPVIATQTGGLTEQLTDGETVFGRLLHPEIKTIVGSQLVPYIYEDFVSTQSLTKAIREMYEMSNDEREELGMKGREYLTQNFAVEKIIHKWDEIITNRVKEYRNPERIRAKLIEV